MRSCAAWGRSSTGSSPVSTGTAAPAPTATCRRTASSSRRPARKHGSSCCSGGAGCNPDADDPLFRPIDADDFRTNGDSAHDFSNLRQNGLVRITLPAAAEHAADRSGHQRSVGRDVRRCVAKHAVRQRRRADRSRYRQSLAARTERDRRLPARRPSGDPAGAGAGGVHESRPGPQSAAAADAGRSGVVPADPVHQPPRPGAVRRPARRHAAAAGSRRSADRARTGRQGGVRARLHAVPRRAGPVERPGASHPVPRHLQRVSTPGRHGGSGPLRLHAVSATARSQRADLRDHAAQRHHGTPHELGSRSRAAHRRHRQRAATGRLEQAGHAGAARARAGRRRTSTTTARRHSKPWSITTPSSSSGSG